MKRTAAILAVGLFAVAIYRAATQSITHDEALTWRMFVATPFSSLTSAYDANHHIIHTWLVRLITAITGVSSFTLRLAALCGAALYLWTLVRIGARLFGGSWLAPATVFLLGAAPMLMDFQVAARGYGLALALFLFALERLIAALTGQSRRSDLWIAGAAMGLSVGCNLVFILPAAAALAGFLHLWRPAAPNEAPRNRRQSAPKPGGRSDLMLALAASLLLLFLIAPVKHMLRRDLYYVGQQTLALSLTDLGANTLAHNEGLALLNMPVIEHDIVKKSFGMGVYPLVLLAGLFIGRRKRDEADPARRGTLLYYLSATALLPWIALVAAHLAAGVPYPTDRTGIYLLPMFLLVLLSLASSERWALKAAPVICVAVLAISFAVQFQTSHFRIWRYDAETNLLVDELNRRGTRNGRPMIAGISWVLQPSVVFYQTTGNLKFFDYAVHQEMRPGLDAYWLASGDWGLIEKFKLRTVRAMPVSQLLIAEPAVKPAVKP